MWKIKDYLNNNADKSKEYEDLKERRIVCDK